jgi:hypothetical protein
MPYASGSNAGDDTRVSLATKPILEEAKEKRSPVSRQLSAKTSKVCPLVALTRVSQRANFAEISSLAYC